MMSLAILLGSVVGKVYFLLPLFSLKGGPGKALFHSRTFIPALKGCTTERRIFPERLEPDQRHPAYGMPEGIP
jgi:hypothetical protein